MEEWKSPAQLSFQTVVPDCCQLATLELIVQLSMPHLTTPSFVHVFQVRVCEEQITNACSFVA